ncbi:hypothetical protein ACWGB8_09100 [Kitasatospora sp. NPDC054939]
MGMKQRLAVVVAAMALAGLVGGTGYSVARGSGSGSGRGAAVEVQDGGGTWFGSAGIARILNRCAR